MNRGLKIFLVITAIILSAAVFWSLNSPIKFNKEKDKRYVEVIAQLQDIGSLQKEYYNQTEKYLGSVDSLIRFADTANYYLKERIDTTIYTKNAQGISIPKDEVIFREIGRVPVKDSIFKGRDYKGLANIAVGTKGPFHMEIRKDYEVNEDSTAVKTLYRFKAYATKREVLDGLSSNYVNSEIELNKGIRDSIISVGSLIMPSSEGNWTPEQDKQAKDFKKKEEEQLKK